jgi:hypothetical protein
MENGGRWCICCGANDIELSRPLWRESVNGVGMGLEQDVPPPIGQAGRCPAFQCLNSKTRLYTPVVNRIVSS